eukprot:4407480-Amphidinium_carterae.1
MQVDLCANDCPVTVQLGIEREVLIFIMVQPLMIKIIRLTAVQKSGNPATLCLRRYEQMSMSL